MQEHMVPQMQQPQMVQAAPLLPGQEDETDELIPTAVVMKNIPFSVSREQLLFVMVGLALELYQLELKPACRIN